MRYTKRTRKGNIRRVLKWYIKECKVSEIDIALVFPELMDIIEGEEEELDFDDVVRAFDFVGVDLVAVPRGTTRMHDWYCITEMPFDDGGKNRDLTALASMRRRIGRKTGKEKKGGHECS